MKNIATIKHLTSYLKSDGQQETIVTFEVDNINLGTFQLVCDGPNLDGGVPKLGDEFVLTLEPKK
jgi:hypothetical protein